MGLVILQKASAVNVWVFWRILAPFCLFLQHPVFAEGTSIELRTMLLLAGRLGTGKGMSDLSLTITLGNHRKALVLSFKGGWNNTGGLCGSLDY